MATHYYEAIQLIERLHRYFLDVVKIELDKKNIQDINNVQTMILHSIGHDELTVGELTLRGYYLGSNVSYNVKKMVANGYLDQMRSVHDKRSIRVKLTDKGKVLHGTIDEMFQRHDQNLSKTSISNDKLQELSETLKMLERFWNSQVGFGSL